MQNVDIEESSEREVRVRRKILVIGRGAGFSQDVVHYAVHLAERLDHDILALSVDTAYEGETFTRRAIREGNALRRKAEENGLRCDHVMKIGDLGSSVEELHHEVKRIEFVVADSSVNKEEVAREVTVPLFCVVSNAIEPKEGKAMTQEQSIEKGKPVGQTIGYGILTAALYAAVFFNADSVMQYFTKGGLYAALPIATVFVFSFAHGAFASNLWSLLGIEAYKKDALRQTQQKVVQKRKQASKRPRAYAYVNPFHDIDR